MRSGGMRSCRVNFDLEPSLHRQNMTNPYLPLPGVQTELVEFDSCGRHVQGALFSPSLSAGRSETAVILVHGVEQFWYVGPTMFLAASLAERGYSAFGYNGIHSGQTFRWSNFETAVQEVGDAVAFMKQRSFKRVVLIGHSLGTPIIVLPVPGDEQASANPRRFWNRRDLGTDHVRKVPITADAIVAQKQIFGRFRQLQPQERFNSCSTREWCVDRPAQGPRDEACL